MHKTSPLFSIAFGFIFLGFSTLVKKSQPITFLDFLMLGFAANRLGRMTAYDKAMEPYRNFFVKTVPDPSGAGETTEPRFKHGLLASVGELLSCPICIGTWWAAVLIYGLTLSPRLTRTFVGILGTIGLGEILNSLVEALSWGGQQSRDMAGRLEK